MGKRAIVPAQYEVVQTDSGWHHRLRAGGNHEITHADKIAAIHAKEEIVFVDERSQAKKRKRRGAAAFGAVLLAVLSVLAGHGVVRVATPNEHVRACVPLDPARRINPGVAEFGLRAPSGLITPAQAEPAVFSADGKVRVVELIAHTQAAGTYDVVDLPQPVADDRPQLGAFALGLMQTPPAIAVDGVAVPMTYRTAHYRFGSACVTREFGGPHAFGWATALNGTNFVLLDLVLHDAKPGAQVWTFGRVTVGPGELVTALPEPTLAGNTVLSCGWMRQRQRREFRLALVPTGDAVARAEALALLSGAGWGVSDQWTRVDAYWPQQLAIADLSHLTDMASRLRGDWARIQGFVSAGLTHGIGVTEGQVGGLIGDYSPRHARYGGVTGGAGIYQRDGMALALTGEPAGLLYYQLDHRTVTDRHAIGLYTDLGTPIDPAVNKWVPSSVNLDEFTSQAKPFPPPSRTTQLDGHDGIDCQHYSRRTGPSKVLAWLSNDAIAKRELELSALLWMRAWNPGGILAGPPAVGGNLGRAHGWGLDTVAAARATTTRHRADFDAWAMRAGAAYEHAQMPNGIFQADRWSKNFKGPPFNSLHAVCQAIELGIGVNGLMGLLGSCGVDVDEVIVQAAREGVSQYLWTGSGTWQFAAVAPAAAGSQPYTTIPTGMVKGTDSWQIGSNLGYWRILRPDDDAARAAIWAFCGGAGSTAQAIAWLRSQAWKNPENQEPMLRALQEYP